MYPTAVIPHSGDGYRLFFLYMPMEYQDNAGQDTFKLYYINTGTNRRYLARSINSGITWTDTQYVNVQDLQKGYEAIIQNPDSNKKYMSYNRWIGQNTSYMCNMVSTDGGFSFADTGVVMQMGEDKSFIWNEDTNEYWGYVRPRNIEPSCYGSPTYGNGVRKIALMKNNLLLSLLCGITAEG